MSSWLRGRSLVALLVFGGWSLLVNARERLAPQRVATGSGAAPQPLPAKRADIVWN